jgi:hypothetical protein
MLAQPGNLWQILILQLPQKKVMGISGYIPKRTQDSYWLRFSQYSAPVVILSQTYTGSKHKRYKIKIIEVQMFGTREKMKDLCRRLRFSGGQVCGRWIDQAAVVTWAMLDPAWSAIRNLTATRPLTQSPYFSVQGKPREGASKLPFCLWSVAVFCSFQAGREQPSSTDRVKRECHSASWTVTMFNNRIKNQYNKYM